MGRGGILFRSWFNEQEDAGATWKAEIEQSIDRFCQQIRKKFKGTRKIPERIVRLEVWANGFKTAFAELEGSQFCSRIYRREVRSSFEEEMTGKELEAYHLHIYFYKSAFVRVFSLLDKLGFFLNDLFELETEKVKYRFSYFTVLRQMHQRHIHTSLEQKLFDVKVKYQTPLNHLRMRRNLEIHSINIELINDQTRKHGGFVDRYRIEPLDENMSDLDQSVQMVYLSLKHVFEYASKMNR